MSFSKELMKIVNTHNIDLEFMQRLGKTRNKQDVRSTSFPIYLVSVNTYYGKNYKIVGYGEDHEMCVRRTLSYHLTDDEAQAQLQAIMHKTPDAFVYVDSCYLSKDFRLLFEVLERIGVSYIDS